MIKRPLDDNYEMAIKDIPTVIKELLMNSLDANATKILLDVNFELFEIKIKDNGTGFNTLRDIGERLVSGNSSSNADNKYGFRGRSLYAIAKVSDNIQIKTKHRNTEPNTKKITYIPQDLKMKVSDSVSDLSLNGQGSILKIVNVFNRFPIRQRCLNLKQLDTQVRTILIELSVINYRCCFQFQSSATSKLFILNKTTSMVKALEQSYDLNLKTAIDVEKRVKEYHLKGIVTTDLKGTPFKLIYVNNFNIQNTELSNMINKIYKHANYAFAISLPYEEIDLNFSIGKDIVSFSDIQNVLNLFQDGSERDNVLNLFQDRKEMAKTRVETMSEPKNDIRAGYSNQLELLIPIKDSKDVVVWNNKIFPISKDRLFPEETVKPIKITKNQILESVVLGQVDRKFIACKTIQSPSLLFLIDQHASHERILLEQFIKGRNERKYECKIVLSQPEHHLLFSKTISGLKNFGIEIEYEKCNDDISLHARLQFPIDGEILKNLIYNCMEIWGKTDKFNEMPLKMMELYKSKSCRNAIMFGDRLTFRDCQDLKTALSFCDFPFQCAHGRPTCVPLIEISTTKKIL